MTTRIIQAPAYQKPSGKLYLSAEQFNLANGIWTKVELDAIAAGFTDGIEDTTNHRIKPGFAGWYNIIGLVMFHNPVAAARYYTRIWANGTTALAQNYSWCGGGDLFSVPVDTLVKLTATDYIELWAESHSGDDTVDIWYSCENTFLSIQRVR